MYGYAKNPERTTLTNLGLFSKEIPYRWWESSWSVIFPVEAGVRNQSERFKEIAFFAPTVLDNL